jgi:tripartite-type tricarboxylate transporter receptor subunit TctC
MVCSALNKVAAPAASQNEENMRLTSSVRGIAAVLVLTAAPAAMAQEYPAKPVRIVVTGVGSGGDFAARLIGQGISPTLGQSVVVDNRGGGVVPGELVAKSPPDGYTLLLYGAPLWIGPMLQQTSYDAARDFAPITLVVRSPNILVVHPSLPVKTTKDVIALAKARPGSLNYATSGNASSGHLSGELFKYMAGIDVVRVNYKGGGAALTDLISGQVQYIFANAGAVAPHLKAGRLKGLAVTSAQPTALIPGYPTIAASGLPGYELESILGMFAPAKTPPAIITRLHKEIVSYVTRPEVKERFFNSGVEAVGSTPEQLAATMKSELGRLTKVVKASGMTAD